MNLSHIKLIDGTDLICIVEEIDVENHTITLSYPIQMIIDPQLGTYGKKWLAFSEVEVATIDDCNVLFVHNASEGAYEHYIEFTKMALPSHLRELLEESETSTKH